MDFIEEGNWILPTRGTLGNKAQNLLENQQIIEAHDFKIPRSLVIPYEFLDVEGPIFVVLDIINKYFPDCPKVAVRSNAPDEDLGSRTPGLYASAEVWHQERGRPGNPNLSYFPLEKVMFSYYSEKARSRRERLGIEEEGMCLLVQEPIQASYSGCFSDIGELAVLTLTDPKEGLNAMQRPSLRKHRVDSQGNITGPGEHTTYESSLAERFRKLADALPEIGDKGWEIEFVGNEDGFYVVQTTPIAKKEKFEVKETENNIFRYRSVLGTGEIITDGVLYIPLTPNLEELLQFDKTHSNYCLATVHSNVTKSMFNPQDSVLNYLFNASVILDIDDLGGVKPFAVHVEQYMREGRIALLGMFTNELADILVRGEDYAMDYNRLRGSIYSPTKLIVKADEIEQKANVELDGKIEDFAPIG